MDFTNLRDLQDRLVRWRIPGNDCMVSIDHQNVYRYHTGWADKEAERPIQGNELYNLWSCSKPITTTLALRLHEQGLFTMNDPLSAYLPEFAEMTVRMKTDAGEEIVPAKKPILIRHLFTMTAGFSYDRNTVWFDEMRRETEGRCPTRAVAGAIAKEPLSFEPGEHWRYSHCHDVLGAFIEVVAGKKLRDYAKEVLFDPLGMEDTCYGPVPEEKKPRMAKQYRYHADQDKYLPDDQSAVGVYGPDCDSGGAGVISTCEDYMKFADTVACEGTAANGYRYLSPASIRLWRTNALGPQQLEDMKWSQLKGYGYGFGVRTMIDPVAGGSLSPIGECGWGGAAGAWLIVDATHHLSLVYLQHMLNPQEEHNAPRIRSALYSSLDF